MDAKTIIARRTIGAPRPIPCLDGEIWIKPRKFSVDATDEINALAYPRRALIRKLRKAAEAAADMKAVEGEEAGAEKPEEAEIPELGDLDPAILATGGLLRLQLKHGVAEHNFDGEPKAPDADWIEAIAQDPELAKEIVKIVAGFNRPLANGSSSSSGTASSTASAGSASAS